MFELNNDVFNVVLLNNIVWITFNIKYRIIVFGWTCFYFNILSKIVSKIVYFNNWIEMPD